MLKDKKVIIIGDKDGIPAPAIEECVKAAGAEVIFAATECYTWAAAGTMDLEKQKKVLDLSEKYNRENLVVILGMAEAEPAGLTAETVTAGDPTFTGPLAGVSLGLSVYHIFELKEQVDAQVYDDQCSIMEMVLDVDGINSEVSAMRQQYSKY